MKHAMLWESRCKPNRIYKKHLTNHANTFRVHCCDADLVVDMARRASGAIAAPLASLHARAFRYNELDDHFPRFEVVFCEIKMNVKTFLHPYYSI